MSDAKTIKEAHEVVNDLGTFLFFADLDARLPQGDGEGEGRVVGWVVGAADCGVVCGAVHAVTTRLAVQPAHNACQPCSDLLDRLLLRGILERAVVSERFVGIGYHLLLG